MRTLHLQSLSQRALPLLTALLLTTAGAAAAQQWNGPNTITDPIGRRGSVGIGTFGPTSLLDVVGRPIVSRQFNNIVAHSTMANAERLRLVGRATDYIIALDDGAGQVVQQWNANIGPSPTYIVGGLAAGRLVFDPGSDRLFSVGFADEGGTQAAGDPVTWQDHFRIQSDGNVFVGATLEMQPAQSGAGAALLMREADGTQTVSLDAEGAAGGALLQLANPVGLHTLSLNANEGSGADVSLFNSVGINTVELDADEQDGAAVRLFSDASVNTVEIRSGDAERRGAEMTLSQSDGTDTVVLDGEGGGGGGGVGIFNNHGVQTMEFDGDEDDAAVVRLSNEAATTTIEMLAAEVDGNGAQMTLHQHDGTATIFLDAEAGGGGAGITLRNSSGGTTVVLDGDEGESGELNLYDGTGSETIRLDASGGDGGAGVSLFNSLGLQTIELDADEGPDNPVIRLFEADGSNTVEILASESEFTGAQITLSEWGGTDTIVLDAEAANGGGARVDLFNSVGTNTIELDGDEDQNGVIRLFGAGGAANVVLNAGNGGSVETGVLQINGGSDLAEPFDIAEAGSVVPGMVVAIDAAHPGRLRRADRAYDRTVAGIVSGAGGIAPGLVMGQEGTIADGAFPVALTGRVYALADAANGPIEPGDLLTTSDTPGHAMKVTDPARAQGAIIGKAMTGLAQGRGLVLVLVALQ